MTDHEDRILCALRLLGPSGGDRGSVVRRAYRHPTPALREKTERILYRLRGRGLVECRGINQVQIWRAVGRGEGAR